MSKRRTPIGKIRKKAESLHKSEQKQGPVQQVAPQVAYRHAQINRNGLTLANLLALQRTVGNRLVQRLHAMMINRANGQQRQKNEEQKRQDVVIIVGRPSRTTPQNETAQEKGEMEVWRAAAYALSPIVWEGLTVDKAFVGLKQMKTPIGKLYIIAHADVSGIGEVGTGGESVSTTVEDVTKRIKNATGDLGHRKPVSVEMLSCFGGGSPKTMGRIGEALGAAKVHAPVQMTVISGRTFKINGRRLTIQSAKMLSDTKLMEYIQKTDSLQYYDFVPGVPHPQTPLSNNEKLSNLVGVLRRKGMIPFISFNDAPGKPNAVAYWKATVEKRSKTSETV